MTASIIYTVRYRKGEAWETHLDGVPIPCGHDDITPAELADSAHGHFTSRDAAAEAVVAAVISDADIEEVCVWMQWPHGCDATGPVMALARDLWMRAAEKTLDADSISDRAPCVLLAHGLDDLIAEMLADVAAETRAVDDARRAYRSAAL